MSVKSFFVLPNIFHKLFLAYHFGHDILYRFILQLLKNKSSEMYNNITQYFSIHNEICIDYTYDNFEKQN